MSTLFCNDTPNRPVRTTLDQEYRDLIQGWSEPTYENAPSLTEYRALSGVERLALWAHTKQGQIALQHIFDDPAQEAAPPAPTPVRGLWRALEASTHYALRRLRAPDGTEFNFPYDTDTDQILALRDYLNAR